MKKTTDWNTGNKTDCPSVMPMPADISATDKQQQYVTDWNTGQLTEVPFRKEN